MKRRIWFVSARSAILLSVMACLVLLTGPCSTQGEASAGSEPFSSTVSEDGGTIVKQSGSSAPVIGMVDLIFCDGKGKVRNEVIGRHLIDKDCLSDDGYYSIYGRVKDEARWFLTLYNPNGERCFEKAFSNTVEALSIVTTDKGHRTAVLLADMANYKTREKTIFLYDRSGNILSQHTGRGADLVSLYFTPNGKHLLSKSPKGMQLFDANDLSQKWRLDGLNMGKMKRDPIAMSSDESKMAVLSEEKIAESGDEKYRPTVFVVDAKSGKMIGKETLPGGTRPSSHNPIKFNAAKGAFEVTSDRRTIHEIGIK